MAVQRLPNPPLVPSSMSSGGEVHSNAMAMGAPGSQPVSAPSPQDPGQAVETLPLPVDTTGQEGAADRWLRDPSGAKEPQPQQNAPFPQAGAFAQAGTEDGNAAMWKKTASSGG